MQCEISAHERRSLYRRNRSAAPLCIPYRATRDPYCNVARNRREKLNRYFARALATSPLLRHPIIARPKSGGAVHNEIKGMSPDPLPVVILTEGEGLGTRLPTPCPTPTPPMTFGMPGFPIWPSGGYSPISGPQAPMQMPVQQRMPAMMQQQGMPLMPQAVPPAYPTYGGMPQYVNPVPSQPAVTQPAPAPTQVNTSQHARPQVNVMGRCAATEEPTSEGRRNEISRCELRVNGTTPVICILDSAASTSLVSKAFLEEIDVPMKQRRRWKHNVRGRNRRSRARNWSCTRRPSIRSRGEFHVSDSPRVGLLSGLQGEYGLWNGVGDF